MGISTTSHARTSISAPPSAPLTPTRSHAFAPPIPSRRSATPRRCDRKEGQPVSSRIDLRFDELMSHRLGRGTERDRARESKSAVAEQLRVLRGRALAPPDVHEHLEIGVKHELRLPRVRGDLALHENETRRARHRSAAGGEDRDRLVVLPVVDDVAQDVDVAAWRYPAEEAAADEVAAVGDSRLLEQRPGALDDLRQLEQDAAQVWILLEDRRQQSAASATTSH